MSETADKRKVIVSICFGAYDIDIQNMNAIFDTNPNIVQT